MCSASPSEVDALRAFAFCPTTDVLASKDARPHISFETFEPLGAILSGFLVFRATDPALPHVPV
jgi:hypothetical protein